MRDHTVLHCSFPAHCQPLSLFNSEGKVQWRRPVASLWGCALGRRENTQLDPGLKFAGQQLDEESGLFYNRHRYYLPESGCYLTPDPIGLAGGMNLYAYAPNPLSYIDPLGLSACGLGKVTGEYSAVKPGPLSDDLAGTFSGGRYKEIILKQDTDFYRAGVSNREYGQFFSLDKPQSVIQTRIDKAVLPKWPGGGESPLDSVFKIKVPAGTKVYVVEVGSQNGFYMGGKQQIVIPQAWNIPGIQVVGKGPLL